MKTIEVSPAELKAALDRAPGSFRLVDCREPDETAIATLPGAIVLPLSTFPEAADRLLGNPDTPVVVYCHHGMRSAHATYFLRSRGLRSTFSLRGGTEAWSLEVDPGFPRY
jgi:adenylyltransferase/sulfurtransferase